MSSPAHATQKISVVPPDKKMEAHLHAVDGILHLPGGQRIITCSHYDSSLRVWDLESGTQVGEAWMDKGSGLVCGIALSPDGKTIASGSEDGAVRLWDIDTGKIIKKWTGHTNFVQSVCWSPDGQRVVSGSLDETFRVWDVDSENGETILILTTRMSKQKNDVVRTVCSYSPDGEMIATGGDNYGLKVWDANTGKLLKTLPGGFYSCLAWTLDGKTLIGSGLQFDTTTWQIEFLQLEGRHISVNAISLSLNERILASASASEQTAQLWNLANNQPVGPPLHHDDGFVKCATFSADGKLLVTGCTDGYMYTWDVSAILSEAGLGDLLLENEENSVNKLLNDDATRRRAPPVNDPRRLPRGFFDDTRDSSTMRGVPSGGRRVHHTSSPRQWLLGRLPSFWRRRRLDTHGTTEPNARSQSSPPRLARNLIPGMLSKRNGSDIQSREPPVVEVPCTSGKPRNYHARKKPVTSSSLHLNPRTMQRSSAATQSTPSSSQQPLPTSSEALPAATTTSLTTGTTSRHNITVIEAGCWIRFLLWIGCASIEHTDHEH